MYGALHEDMKVTTKDIDKFATQYVGSAEERADVLKFYVEGDLGFVIENVMLSSEADRERFEEMLGELIRTAIRQGEAQPLPLLEASGRGSAQATKRRRKAQREAALCEATAPSDLLQQIQARRQQRGSLLQQLEEKYSAPPPPPKKGAKGMKRPAAKR